MPASLYLYVPDCDAVHERALAAGATLTLTPALTLVLSLPLRQLGTIHHRLRRVHGGDAA